MSALTLKQVQKNRKRNRRLNKLVEQIRKIQAQLAAWTERLDNEQDEANKAMEAEIARLENAAEVEIERLQNQIEEIKSTSESKVAETKTVFTAIIEEAADEAVIARNIQSNVQTLTSGSPV